MKGGKRVVRERFGVDPGYLHRRSFLHSAVGLPLAHDRAQSRSAAARAGDQGDQFLRGLRVVRRGRRMRRCCARPSIAPRSSPIRRAGIASRQRIRDAVIGWLQTASTAPDALTRSTASRKSTRIKSGAGFRGKRHSHHLIRHGRPGRQGSPHHHRHRRARRRRRRRARRLDRRSGATRRLSRAGDLGARRRAAHRRDGLLRGAVPQDCRAGRRTRAGARLDADAGRRRDRARLRADGGGARRRTRLRHAGPRRCSSLPPIVSSP